MSRALPILVAIVLAVYSLIDCVLTDPAEVPGPRKPVWGALILLIPILGPLGWIIARRARRRPPPPPRRQAPRPVAPDDNPEFLRELRGLDDRHEQMLKQWEAELRRREDELRKPPEADEDPR